MEFTHTMTTKASIKKLKKYNFEEAGITAEILKKAKKHTHNNPLFVKGKRHDFKLFKQKGKMRLYMLHSYDAFDEIIGSGSQTKIHS